MNQSENQSKGKVVPIRGFEITKVWVYGKEFDDPKEAMLYMEKLRQNEVFTGALIIGASVLAAIIVIVALLRWA